MDRLESPHKGNTGWTRMVNATRYSIAGIAAALRHEDAFRVELCLAVILIPAGLLLGRTGAEKALLIASVLLVLIVELVNSAIEAVVDRVSLESHELAKRAKDMGSAAVMLSLLNAGTIWLLILAL
jgi:diacylglycerol kinase (ATP)